MVFSSYEFVLIFLPLVYLGFLLVHRFAGWRGVYSYLAAASLVFYGQWSLALLAILFGSVVGNFLFANLILSLQSRQRLAGAALTAGVIANLASLGYFKYTNFLIDVVNQTTGTGFSHLDIILPIGISFYTFIQIGFLVEAFVGQADRPQFGKYVLFATFFPCVTAGPLVLQREIFDQMKDRTDPAFSSHRVAVAITMFCIGLFKKVVFADSIAPFANLAFDGVATGAGIDFINAWAGALAYTLQLYFDFSGYSDMAVGLGFLFGIKLPLNFNSPLKAATITDFWRRWHMTMTRFFTTYLFTPMAMKNSRRAILNQHGPVQRFVMTAAVPVIWTFLIAGIWHGAGWTFVVFGLIHGFALAINHGWREFNMPDLGKPVGWILTMATVITGLVVFRAPDLGTAQTMLAGMWGFGEQPLGAMVDLDLEHVGLLILGLGAIVLTAPNSQEILRQHWISSDPKPDALTDLAPRSAWRATPMWATATAVALVVAVTSISSASTFLYYQF